MSKQIEAPALEWSPSTRTHKLDEEISELQLVRSLIPTEEDFLKYSLTSQEVFSMFPSSYSIEKNLRINRHRNAANGAMVILRKRDAESPEMQISYSGLRKAIKILVDDEPFGDAAFIAISVLESNGLIDTNHLRYVKTDKPKVEAGVPVPF